MKKPFLILTLLLLFSFSVKAQFTPNVAISAGLPIGDSNLGDTYSISVDAYYMKYLNNSFDAGFTTGYTAVFNDSFNINRAIIPLAGAIRYKFLAAWSVGTDLGYALGISNTGSESGVYYKPVVGYDFGDKGQIMLSFQGVLNDIDTNYIGLGYSYTF